MKWTDDNLDVLQNLEFSVVQIWRANREMSDYAALHAYDAAYQLYRAESRGHAPKPHTLTGLEATVFEAVKAACDSGWDAVAVRWLGGKDFAGAAGKNRGLSPRAFQFRCAAYQAKRPTGLSELR